MNLKSFVVAQPASAPALALGSAVLWAAVLLLPTGTLVPARLFAQPEDDRQGERKLHEKAAKIRAAAAELLKIRRIPWVTDPAEGFRLARKENRPVFLYLQAGNPLEDC